MSYKQLPQVLLDNKFSKEDINLLIELLEILGKEEILGIIPKEIDYDNYMSDSDFNTLQVFSE